MPSGAHPVPEGAAAVHASKASIFHKRSLESRSHRQGISVKYTIDKVVVAILADPKLVAIRFFPFQTEHISSRSCTCSACVSNEESYPHKETSARYSTFLKETHLPKQSYPPRLSCHLTSKTRVLSDVPLVFPKQSSFSCFQRCLPKTHVSMTRGSCKFLLGAASTTRTPLGSTRRAALAFRRCDVDR